MLSIEEFNNLELDEKKKVLLEVLDKVPLDSMKELYDEVMLYVNDNYLDK